MTAMPHDMPDRPVSPRNGFTARLVRPVTSRRSFSDSETTAKESASEPLMSGSGAAAIGSGPLSVTSVSSALGLSHLRFVLAGRRVRLGNGAFVIVMLAACTGILFALLLINTFLAENSFQLTKIQSTSRDLTIQQQTLAGQLAAAESPIGLEDKARALGMVPAGSPVFLNLQDGQLLGDAQPASMPQVAKPKKPKPAATVDPNGSAAAGETPVDPSLPAGGLVPVGVVPSGAGGLVPNTASTPGETTTGVQQGAAQSGEQSLTPTIPAGGEQPVGLVSGGNR